MFNPASEAVSVTLHHTGSVFPRFLDARIRNVLKKQTAAIKFQMTGNFQEGPAQSGI